MPAGSAGFLAWVAQCATQGRQLGSSARNGKTGKLGEAWSISLPTNSLGSVLLPPNPPYPNCCTSGTNSLNQLGMYTLSSKHPGGANVVMCDGSVKFLKNSTANPVVWALGSRAGGEVLSADAY